MTIFVGGKPHKWDKPTISYEEVLALKFGYSDPNVRCIVHYWIVPIWGENTTKGWSTEYVLPFDQTIELKRVVSFKITPITGGN